MENKRKTLDGVQAAMIVSERWIKDEFVAYENKVEEESILTLLQLIKKAKTVTETLLSRFQEENEP